MICMCVYLCVLGDEHKCLHIATYSHAKPVFFFFLAVVDVELLLIRYEQLMCSSSAINF